MVQMSARSLNDFIHLRSNEEDAPLRHAIDQLEALQHMDSASLVNKFAVRFGELTIDDEVTFNFELPKDAARWPAPHFGRYPLHEKLIRPRRTAQSQKANRRKSNKSGRKRCKKPSKKGSSRRSAEEDDTIVLRPGQPSRSSPLRFLDLPPEIRNQIYHLLTVQEDAIQPSLRCVFPFNNSRISRKKHIRRSPAEPALATVNRQIRRESLSIFYGFNRFILIKNSCRMFQDLSMTNPAIMRKWKPGGGIAGFLAHIEVQFSAMSPIGGINTWISYILRRRADGSFTVELKTLGMPIGSASRHKRLPEAKKTESHLLCACSESDIMPKLQTALEAKECGEDLVEVAVFVIEKRLEHLFGASDGIRTPTYQPGAGSCSRCEKQNFEAVHVGL